MELQHIQNKIFEVRGVKIMLDSDLAEMYDVETKVLNQSVKRNIQRFPSDFMFQLTKKEWQNLKSQFVTSNWGGRRTLPHAFTEQGVAMLSGLLNSKIAIQVNINIMRAFVSIRQGLSCIDYNKNIKELKNCFEELKADIEDMFRDQNDINEDTRMQLELFSKAMADLQSKEKFPNKPRPKVGYLKD